MSREEFYRHVSKYQRVMQYRHFFVFAGWIYHSIFRWIHFNSSKNKIFSYLGCLFRLSFDKYLHLQNEMKYIENFNLLFQRYVLEKIFYIFFKTWKYLCITSVSRWVLSTVGFAWLSTSMFRGENNPSVIYILALKYSHRQNKVKS